MKLITAILLPWIIAFAFYSSNTRAAEWVPITTSDGYDYEARYGSVTYWTGTRGEVIEVTVRAFVKQTKEWDFGKIYIYSADCPKGGGTIINTNMNGSNPESRNWAKGGGTNGSFIAEFLCTYTKNGRVDKSAPNRSKSYL